LSKLAILNDFLEATQGIKEHSSPSKLGLAHVRHLVLVASSNNSVDSRFYDHVGFMKICL